MKKFWEELISYFPLLRHGLHRKRKKNCGDTQTYRQKGDFISLLTKIREINRQQDDLISFISFIQNKENWKKDNLFDARKEADFEEKLEKYVFMSSQENA
jgi:hypothetical protein